MSKGLEALKYIKRDYAQFMSMYDKEQLDTIEKELKVLDIIKRHPFILERLFDEGGMRDDYNHDYWWGVVTNKEVEMVKEWLNNDE